MLRKGWNFRGDIALPLEWTASRHYGEIMRPMGKIYDADSIEQGSFVEVMIMLLQDKEGMKIEDDDMDEFVKECAPYRGKSGHLVLKEEAQRLFDRFKDLYSE